NQRIIPAPVLPAYTSKTMRRPDSIFQNTLPELPLPQRFRRWWRRQAPHRQDRFAMLGPLAAASMLFLAAGAAAFSYLRLKEIEREQWLFWLVGMLSVLTAWMLIANWRHTKRRMQAQQALLLETNFRRAMENSMPTGMRALDLQGRITYVNAAFCQMTGWSEEELVGATAPFPYWPEGDHEMLAARLEDELAGRVTASGLQVRIKRKDGSLFDARIHVSPLIDSRGQQTGWMTSMTDITEPNRVREQLYASYERFTTVLEALDASISVAPLGSDELLFANKMYRHWFND